MKSFTTLVAFLLAFTLTEGSRILIAAPHGTKSHQNSYIPLTKELVKRGHHVTIVTNYLNEDLRKLENVRQIWIEELVIDMSVYPNPFEALTTISKRIEMVSVFFNAFFSFPTKIANATYGDPRVQQLMLTESFDLVLVAEFCGVACYPLGWHFKAPVISMSPNVLYPGRAALLGDEEHFSYAPFVLSPFSDKMNLFQRTMNVILSKLFTYFAHDWHLDTVESIYKKFIKPECPSIIEMEKNFSLVFTNTHPTFAYPRTLPPQVIEVGGLHCRPAKPLPKDMEEFVTGSDAGFILFGIGSILNMEDMPEVIMQSFIKAFARLPQRVVWQWKGKVRSDLPKNVLAVPWLPQQDLLGHRNCRAFLTHGGLNSLQEAIYHGVPILGLPFGTDQILNIGRAVNEGYGLRLDWTDITQETLSKSLQELLHNPRYATTAKKLASLFRDQIQPPMERAVFWTEFLLRHKGADHLRLGSIDLEPYQRALVDVYIVLALCAIFPLVLTYFCVRKCCYRRKIVNQKEKQQ